MKKLHFVKSFLFMMIMIPSIVNALVEDLMLQISSGTQAEINSIVNPTVGLVVFNTDDQKLYTYNGTQWNAIEGDKQNITDSNLTGTTLTIGIQNGTAQSVDLSSLVNDADADSTNELLTSATLNGADLELVDAGGTKTVDLSDFNDSEAIATVQSNLDTHITDDNDKDSSNEIQTLSISGQDISLSNGGGTVSVPTETTTVLSQDTTSGLITYTNEVGSDQIVNVVSTDTDNQIVVGTDGGAYVGQTVYAGYFVINSNGAKTITGIPFEPSQIIFSAQANVGAINVDARSASNNIVDVFVGSMNGFARKGNSGNVQQVIFVGQSGYETGSPYVNHISRYASDSNCIGIRYGDQNGNEIGKQTASLTSFNSDGFTINATRSGNASNKNLVVLFTAYK